MRNQPVLGPDGQLLDASEIEWYNDSDQMMPNLFNQPPVCEKVMFKSTAFGDY
jgi:hypothetical protein